MPWVTVFLGLGNCQFINIRSTMKSFIKRSDYFYISWKSYLRHINSEFYVCIEKKYIYEESVDIRRLTRAETWFRWIRYWKKWRSNPTPNCWQCSGNKLMISGAHSILHLVVLGESNVVIVSIIHHSPKQPRLSTNLIFPDAPSFPRTFFSGWEIFYSQH